MNTTSSEISLKKSLIPIIILISLLFYNIISFENNDWLGEYTYHYLLISSSVIAVFLGFSENIGISHIIKRIIESIKSITIPIIILLLVGALAGTWKVSGIIPAMVYYGLNLIDPSVFLPLTLIVSTLVSLTTGSSYTTNLSYCWNRFSCCWNCI